MVGQLGILTIFDFEFALKMSCSYISLKLVIDSDPTLNVDDPSNRMDKMHASTKSFAYIHWYRCLPFDIAQHFLFSDMKSNKIASIPTLPESTMFGHLIIIVSK